MSNYIVRVRKEHDPRGVANEHNLKPKHVWEFRGKLKGFAAELTDEEAEKLRKHPHVESVTEDQTVVALELPWGIDRVDQRIGTDGVCALTRTGKGVPIYVADTGIRYSHREFGGRARFGFDAFDGDGSDQQGHGTHVSGTAAGATVGLAKESDLISVRVLDATGSGSYETVIAGLNYISTQRRGVVNMSIGGPRDETLNAAVDALVELGFVCCIAAGNGNTDALETSPASAPLGICIGATTIADERAWFSNFGAALKVWAPGVDIPSADGGSDSGYRNLSGTSMACPHVAGVAALALEEAPDATPAEVLARIQSTSTQGVVKGGGEMRDLLYARMDSVQPPDEIGPNLPPTADFTWRADDSSGPNGVLFTDTSQDPDGVVVWRQWAFGDGWVMNFNAPAELTWHYANPGTYTASLDIKDDRGGTASVRKDVTTSASTPPDPEPIPEPDPVITLAVNVTNKKGIKSGVLSFSGIRTSNALVHRNEQTITVPNNGTWPDPVTWGKGKPAPKYRVCEDGGAVCSVEVTP